MNVQEKIIDRVSIEEIYPNSLKNNRGNCCTHENTSSPSFTFYPQTDSWYCWSCNKGGSVVDLYSHLHGTNYKESLYELAKTYKIDIPEKEKQEIKKKSEIYEIFNFFCEICHKNLLNDDLYEDVKNRRGFDENTIKSFKIGLFDDSIKVQMEKKFEKQDLFDSGFLNEKLNWYFGKRIVYPYLNMKEEPIYFIYRKIDNEPDFMNAKYIKHRKEYVKESLFGINSVNKFKDKPLIITEGITDAISVIQSEYPCISPVTIRFKEEDHEKILRYAKRFKKVVIINDNEENNKGLEGAKDTLRHLLKNRINIYINEITKLPNVSKIDLNDYLQEDCTNKLNELVDQAIEGFEFLLSSIDDKSTTEDLEDVLILIPKDDILKRDDVCKEIKKKRGTSLSDLKALHKLTHLKEKERLEKENRNKDIFSDEIKKEKEELICSYPFRFGLIKNYEDGVYFCVTNEDGYTIEEPALESGIKLKRKMRYLGRDYFSYEFMDYTQNTQSRTLILMNLKNFLYGGDKGRDVIKKLINCMSYDLSYTKLEPILGFNDGWKLPQFQKRDGYDILAYTDTHKITLERAKHIIKKTTKNNFEEVKKKLKRIIEITDIPKDILAYVIGWSISAIFVVPIMEVFNLFPLLVLSGDPQRGKTKFCNLFVVHFYDIHKTHFAGSTMKKMSRLEDALASSTAPLQFDEFSEANNEIIETIKANCTDNDDYTRKLNLLEEIRKPKVAPICITTNKVPEQFLDVGMNERLVHLNLESNKKIIDNPEWISLFNELKKAKLFTYLFYATKDWKNKDITEPLQYAWKNIEEFKDDARKKKKFIIAQFGLTLFKKVFDIDLLQNLTPETLEYSEQFVGRTMLEYFKDYFNHATDFDRGTNDQYGFHRGDNIWWISCELETNNTNDYIFTPSNLSDFEKLSKRRYHSLHDLGQKLIDSLPANKKSLVNIGNYSINSIKYNTFKIKSNFIEELN